jgi:hypothetical protein
MYLFTRSPESQEVFDLAGAFHHLASDRAVDSDALPHNVFQYPLIGRRRPPYIVFSREAINRNNHRKVL